MAKIVRNPKGYLIIAMEPWEAFLICGLGTENGLICNKCHTNKKLDSTMCYIAIENALYCPDCMKEYVKTKNKNYSNLLTELQNFNKYAKLLNLRQV